MNSEEITVRDIKYDVDEIFKAVATFKEFFAEEENVIDDEYRRAYAQKLSQRAHVIAAYFNNEIVGVWAYYLNDENGVYLYSSLLATRQDIGVLSSLVILKIFNFAWEAVKDSGFSKIKLSVRKDNDKALRLYRALGLAYSGDRSEEKIFMEGSLEEAGKRVEKLARRLR